ncbi:MULTISPECIES: HTH domain-containing protein [Acidianus]|uniref:Uncharacterized protein n=1 Tax=Candidatus Acidianus copahuensis TaxID=1160895 RepID=A0A031LSX9_9CREN|nr:MULTISPECIES: HTH domain-containing protein [Acidianus]EZQ10870.1 hypothetical protein CM19_03300 [Candidatus Acidianus copahuensis]NON62017.1 winged helix-turn-helix transcriptional regulator [Acidianus sp. RZ1]
MELTPRLQDILNMVKNKGEINVKDLALELKVSPKTAKGYVKELERLGFITVDEREVIKLKAEGENAIEKLEKIVQIHESEINALKKEIDDLKEEVLKLKRKSKA